MGLALLLFHLSAFAGDSLENIAKSEAWQRLLYYRYHWGMGRLSAVDGEGFFLAPDGKKDPLNELRATIEALEGSEKLFGPRKQRAYCAFPARRIFLEGVLEKRFPVLPCAEFEAYLDKLAAKSISLVYATSYPNNPASMFGHTFFRVSSARNSASHELSLLDTSVNYAAQVPPDENPFAFAWFGLTGGYQGRFSLVPFFAKVEEYGFFEGRDLWEYELNLRPDELQMVLAALWEIETNSFFDYYFFDENCSLQLLLILEIARSDWNISQHFLSMIPGESVRRLAEVPGAIRSIRFRPSLLRRLSAQVESLSPSERRQWQELRQGGAIRSAGPNALVAYSLYLQSEKQAQKDSWSEAQKTREREVLLAIATSSQKVDEAPIVIKEKGPDVGHWPNAVALGMRWIDQKRPSPLLRYRPAYHDLLDSDLGYRPHNEFRFPNFSLSWREGSLRFEQGEILSIVSLSPWNHVSRPLSWRSRVSWGDGFSGRRGWNAEGGIGSAFSLNERSTVWMMALAAGEVPSGRGPFFQAVLGGEAGALADWGRTKFLANARALWSENKKQWFFPLNIGVSLSVGKDWSLRGEGNKAFGKGSYSKLGEITLVGIRYF